MEKIPAFFTFFRAETDMNKMKIPISFTQRMRKSFPKYVFLRDRHNKQWTVKMAKIGDYWYFTDGWNAFVNGNPLTSMDLIVFSYFRENLFNVKMYGLSATEKNIRPSMQKSENEEDEDDDDDVDYEDEYEDYDDEYDFDEITESENGVQLSEDSEYEDEEGVQVSLENGNDPSMQKSENKEDEEDDDDDVDYEDEYEDYDDEYDFDEITESENSVQLSEDSEFKDEEGVQVSLKNVNDDGVVGNHRQEMSPLYLYPKCYGMEIFEAGLAEKPKNPFFVTKLMPKRTRNLFIPKDVIYDYNLTVGHEIILVDQNKREFWSKCGHWSDGRICVGKGWPKFCKKNSVNENDKCICEFVEKEGDERQYLHISIVHPNI